MWLFFSVSLGTSFFLFSEKRKTERENWIEEKTLCICYLLGTHPKHWVPGSVMLLADMTHFEALFQGIVPKILMVSQPFRRRLVLITMESTVGRLFLTCKPAVFITGEENNRRVKNSQDLVLFVWGSSSLSIYSFVGFKYCLGNCLGYWCPVLCNKLLFKVRFK